MLFLFAVSTRSQCHGSSFASSRSKASTTSTWLQSAASDSLGSQGSQIQRYLQGAALLQVAGGGSHLGSDGTMELKNEPKLMGSCGFELLIPSTCQYIIVIFDDICKKKIGMAFVASVTSLRANSQGVCLIPALYL